MRLITFEAGGRTRLGVVVDGEVVDLAAAEPALPSDMVALLAAGPDALTAARRASQGRGRRLALDALRLLAPVPAPPKFLGVGLNYADHIAETGLQPPERPPIFTKQRTCVTGPYEPIHRPRASAMLDYEGELGVVIGRRCRHVPAARASEVIAGYVVVNDVSVRDFQFHSPTMTMGKSFDTHGPFGPWLMTADELGDPHHLALRTTVNGERRQTTNTDQLVFNCFAIIEYLSTVCTLEPGDVITTGSSSGVGAFMSPPQYLAPGDVVRVEIDGLGHIENRVIEEPDTARL
jgi:2-keto-4-pentenoate hydratase/2-oxohepta-3-ene-1,7-dioic acid hydratase in catechol pathway